MNSSNTQVQTVDYKGWNCLRLFNGKIELVVTLDVGPRVIRCAFLDGPNFFKEFENTLGVKGGEEWNIFGGHRLWHAPENNPRTYFPDNFPVQFEKIEGGAKFIQDVETTTGIQKEIEIRLSPDSAKAKVLHRLRNTNLWNVELAPWAPTVMDAGGTNIVPLPPRGTHPEDLLPTSSLIVWPFTDMSDARWTWGEKYVLLRQDAAPTNSQKIGVHASDGWTAYTNKNQMFLKTFEYSEGATYPDMGSVVEIFTNQEMIELESLGPVVSLEPNGIVEYEEKWHLFDGVSTPINDDDVETNVLPHVKSVL